ncbi:hypothetical protein [Nocardiopsis salina]|uniref:hypothetical protein n=1 Tax=Nocardiopsis salina TaxID=245836 RepID=UPI000369EDB5|nr:hypothetical protein [Nocardiopsis salina]
MAGCCALPRRTQVMMLGFDQLRYARIWVARSLENPAWQVVRNCVGGMAEESRIRRHLRTDADWRDSVVLSYEWSA